MDLSILRRSAFIINLPNGCAPVAYRVPGYHRYVPAGYAHGFPYGFMVPMDDGTPRASAAAPPASHAARAQQQRHQQLPKAHMYTEAESVETDDTHSTASTTSTHSSYSGSRRSIPVRTTTPSPVPVRTTAPAPAPQQRTMPGSTSASAAGTPSAASARLARRASAALPAQGLAHAASTALGAAAGSKLSKSEAASIIQKYWRGWRLRSQSHFLKDLSRAATDYATAKGKLEVSRAARLPACLPS